MSSLGCQGTGLGICGPVLSPSRVSQGYLTLQLRDDAVPPHLKPLHYTLFFFTQTTVVGEQVLHPGMDFLYIDDMSLSCHKARRTPRITRGNAPKAVFAFRKVPQRWERLRPLSPQFRTSFPPCRSAFLVASLGAVPSFCDFGVSYSGHTGYSTWVKAKKTRAFPKQKAELPRNPEEQHNILYVFHLTSPIAGATFKFTP